MLGGQIAREALTHCAQEFIPEWDDPVAALRHAAQVCDV